MRDPGELESEIKRLQRQLEDKVVEETKAAMADPAFNQTMDAKTWLRAEIAEAKLAAAKEWQPIETLPHQMAKPDATPEELRIDEEHCGKWHGPVLVLVPDQFGLIMMVAQMDDGAWLYGPDEERCYSDLTTQPTHWMPLPEPPTGTTEPIKDSADEG